MIIHACETATNSWLPKDYLGDWNHETIVLPKSVSLLFINAKFHDEDFFYVLELNAYVKDNLNSQGSMFLTPNYCHLPLYSNLTIYSSCLGSLPYMKYPLSDQNMSSTHSIIS